MILKIFCDGTNESLFIYQAAFINKVNRWTLALIQDISRLIKWKLGWSIDRIIDSEEKINETVVG